MPTSKEIFYAAIGAGDAAVAKLKAAGKVADRNATRKSYEDLVKRGRLVAGRIRNSRPSKVALSQTKTARSQVKAATTSVTKAAAANAKAARNAAAKIAKPS